MMIIVCSGFCEVFCNFGEVETLAKKLEHGEVAAVGTFAKLRIVDNIVCPTVIGFEHGMPSCAIKPWFGKTLCIDLSVGQV